MAYNYTLDFVNLPFVKQSPLMLDGEQQLEKRPQVKLK